LSISIEKNKCYELKFSQLFENIENNFVGRENVLNEMNQWFSNSFHSSVLLLLKGNAGVGKTSLIKQFLEQNSESKSVVFQGKFDQIEGTQIGLSVVSQILSQLFTYAMSFGAQLRKKLSDLLPQHLAGAEAALLSVSSVWKSLITSVPPMEPLPPQQEILRINKAIISCFRCVGDATNLEDGMFWIVFGISFHFYLL
jgi:predicted ATPase